MSMQSFGFGRRNCPSRIRFPVKRIFRRKTVLREISFTMIKRCLPGAGGVLQLKFDFCKDKVSVIGSARPALCHLLVRDRFNLQMGYAWSVCSEYQSIGVCVRRGPTSRYTKRTVR